MVIETPYSDSCIILHHCVSLSTGPNLPASTLIRRMHNCTAAVCTPSPPPPTLHSPSPVTLCCQPRPTAPEKSRWSG